jgi:hypothetical protein
MAKSKTEKMAKSKKPENRKVKKVGSKLAENTNFFFLLSVLNPEPNRIFSVKRAEIAKFYFRECVEFSRENSNTT